MIPQYHLGRQPEAYEFLGPLEGRCATITPRTRLAGCSTGHHVLALGTKLLDPQSGVP